MSTTPVPSGKPRRRDQILKRFRSHSPKPSSTTNATTPLKSSAPLQNVPTTLSQQSSSISVTSTLPSLSSAFQQGNLSTPRSDDFLDAALQRISDGDREILQPFILSTKDDINGVLQRTLVAAKEKQAECDTKRWTFTISGRTITLKEEADKIVRWLDRFKAVGDVAVNVDPIHAGLPWAGVRFLLEVAVSEANQMESLLVGCETALYMINRLKAYLGFWRTLPDTLTKTNLEGAMVRMYARILTFLAYAINTYQQSAFQRALKAFWQHFSDFERDCKELAGEVEIEASTCDRVLRKTDNIIITQSYQHLQTALKELQQIHRIQDSLDRIEKKIDLDKLKFIKEATFDAYGQVHTPCHPATRQTLLRDIQNWARQPDGKSIFWLQGMAGTGKSTISMTMARWLSSQQSQDVVRLGASFFFKRGEGYRSSAAFFFPTIVHQLVQKVSGLQILVAQAVESNPDICSKSLGDQFRVLIRQPFQQLVSVPGQPVYIIVVDALDECKTDDIDVILRLWSEVPGLTDVQLRLFVTSRPETPIQLGFLALSTDDHLDMVLHEVSQPVIEHDIFAYFKDEFTTIRKGVNRNPLYDQQLGEDWPGEKVLRELTNMAVPLFIVAATICRFIHDPDEDAEDRLATILSSRQLGHMSTLAQTYQPVIEQSMPSKDNRYMRDEEQSWFEFRTIVGSIVVLAEPLSAVALATLLQFSAKTVRRRLSRLSSVLQIPPEKSAPVRPLHLSFREFLTSSEIADRPFAVDSTATHTLLFTKCIELLSRPDQMGLRENICSLSYPGQLRRDVHHSQLIAELPPEMQYACRYWVYHAHQSRIKACDDDIIHVFLKRHFLHWLEALSLLDCLATAIDYVSILQLLVAREDSRHIGAFLQDAQRFVLANRYICNQAPLQLYSSAIVFAPQRSIVREVCGQIPGWVQQACITPTSWDAGLQTLEGHTRAVFAVVFSPDGSHLASAGDDTVRLWDTKTGQEIQKLEHAAVVRVIFSPNGLQLASASENTTVRVWNAKTGQRIHNFEAHTDRVEAVMFSPDGTQLASAEDKIVCVRDTKTGQRIYKLEGHTDTVRALSFSSDNFHLASASRDYTVRVWDLKTGQEIQKLEGHDDFVTEVLFSPDSLQLASASDDTTISLWDTKKWQRIYKLEGHTHCVNAIAFSNDSSQLVSAGDQTVRVWDTKTGQEIHKLEGHTSEVEAVAFSPNGLQLASASDGDWTVRVWDAKTGQEKQKLVGHTNMSSAVVFSPDGLQLASASYDFTVRVWDVKSEQKIQKLEEHFEPIKMIVSSPDGLTLASASRDHFVRVWNTRTGQEIQKLVGHNAGFDVVAFSPNGLQLASASRDYTVYLWDTKTWQKKHKFEGHTDSVNTVIFSPNSSQLASASLDTTVYVWDTETRQKIYKLEGHVGAINSIAFSFDGAQLVSACQGGTVRVWDIKTGQELHEMMGHSHTIEMVIFSPDGSQLASASWDGTVQVWNVKTGQEIQKLEGHSRLVEAVAFSPNGLQLASAGWDHTVRVWDAQTGIAVHVLEDYPDIERIKFSQDAQSLLTNRGTIPIPPSSLTPSNKPSTANNNLWLREDWIESGNRRVLWLPPGWRNRPTDVHGTLIAIGRASGQVSFLRIEYA